MQSARLFKSLSALVLTISLLTISSMAVTVGKTTANSLNFRKDMSTDSSVIGSIPMGSNVAIIQAGAQWYKIGYNGLVGYVSSEYIIRAQDSDFKIGNGVVNTRTSVNVRSQPNTSSSVVTKVSQGRVLELVGIKDTWYKVKVGSSFGYIHPDYIEISRRQIQQPARSSASTSNSNSASASFGVGTSTNVKRQQVLDTAAKYLGVPYVYAGSTPRGFDCSGFTSYVFRELGISILRTSASQYSSTTRVSKSDILPGDLVFFGTPSSRNRVGHVGIYVGNNKFIHSPNGGGSVRYESLSKGYYTKYYIGAGRVIFD